MAILLFILFLVLLIIIHELGHFAVAKWFGIQVDEFGIFFPPRIAAVRFGETEYSINWVPLGGFVRIRGENAQDSGGNPRAFSNKSRWKQALVVLAGVCMNILAAWLLASAGYMAGLPTAVDHDGIGTVTNARPMVVAVLPDSPAEQVGLMPGDIVEVVETGTAKLDARTLNTDLQADLVRGFIGEHADESLVITVLRSGEDKTYLAKASDNLVDGRKVIGIDLDDVGTLKLAPHEALIEGAVLAKNIFVQTAAGLGGFFLSLMKGQADFNQVAGPIGIVSMGGTAVHEGFASVIALVSSISMALAIFNLVPIPGLDGGKLLIIAIEGVLRRPVSQKIVSYATLIGLALLVLLVVVVSYHDVARLVG